MLPSIKQNVSNHMLRGHRQHPSSPLLSDSLVSIMWNSSHLMKSSGKERPVTFLEDMFLALTRLKTNNIHGETFPHSLHQNGLIFLKQDLGLT